MTEPLEVSPLEYHSRLTLNRTDIFDADSWLSKSKLWELKNCSLYRWRFAPKTFAGSDAADWGSLIDCLLTTPDDFDKITACHSFDSFRTKEAREFKAEAKEKGLILVDSHKEDQARKAAGKILANKEAAEIIERSKKQVILLNQLKGVNFKGLVDLAPEGMPYLADLKTTADLSLRGISKTIDTFGYHVQAGIYLKLWNLCFPDDPRDRWRFVWQQSSPPYEVAVTELPSFDISAGEEWAANQLDRLIEATESGRWPNVCNDSVALVGRPSYAVFQDEEDFEELAVAPSSAA